MRKKHKMAKVGEKFYSISGVGSTYPQRQLDQSLEMLLLQRLDKADSGAVRAYRLHVKSRLYRFNYVRFPIDTMFKTVNVTDIRSSGNTLPNDSGREEGCPEEDVQFRGERL